MSEPIVGRDPLDKTLVEDFVRSYPQESDEQIAARMCRAARSMGGDVDTLVTPEIVAQWRPEVSA